MLTDAEKQMLSGMGAGLQSPPPAPSMNQSPGAPVPTPDQLSMLHDQARQNLERLKYEAAQRALQDQAMQPQEEPGYTEYKRQFPQLKKRLSND